MRKVIPYLFVLIAYASSMLSVFSKKLNPALFGTAWIQWPLAFISAICIPLAILQGLRLLTRPGFKKVGILNIFLAGAMWVGTLTLYGAGYVMMSKTQLALESLESTNAEVLRKFARQTVLGESERNRKLNAKAFYIFSGAALAWKADDGTYVEYAPDAKDREMQHSTRETERTTIQTKNLIDSQLKQFSWLFAWYFGSFALISFTGLLIQAYRRPVFTQATRPDLNIRGSESIGFHLESWLTDTCNRYLILAQDLDVVDRKKASQKSQELLSARNAMLDEWGPFYTKVMETLLEKKMHTAMPVEPAES